MEIFQIADIVKDAAKIFNKRDFVTYSKGGVSNIVTSSDIAVQNFLRERLSQILPGCGFICEENDIKDANHDYVWIIDPIDGTQNFRRGIDQCAISVALRHDDDIVMGIVYLPWTGEMFYAEKGRGASRNGEPIHVSDRPFDDALMCTALPVYYKNHAAECSAVINEVFSQCNDIRRFGAAAPELCYIAMGRCEMYFEYRLGPWDYAGASIILQEAGGIISDLCGEKINTDKSSGIIAANTRENYNRLLQIVRKHIQ